MIKTNQLIALGLLVWLAPGCTLAPKYTRPVVSVPATWPGGEAYKPIPISSNSPAPQAVDWQVFLTDERLRQVVNLALTNNRDLRVAVLNVQRAQTLYGVQRSELLPVVNGTASGGRQRAPSVLSPTGSPETFNSYSVNLGVTSWELDFFGRIRSLKDRALDEYLASEQARRNAQITLISSVAQAYLAVAADYQNIRLAQTTLEAQQSSYTLIKRRHELGLAPELDVYRAQTPVEVARRDVARYVQLAARDENALNLLAGAAIPASLLPKELDQVKPPGDIGAGLSSDVLLRRPDVLQAEDQLKAANADIGAARAAFFPQISLTAAIGNASSDLSALFKSASGSWSYTPQIVMPIFDARTWYANRAAQVQQEIAVAQYQRSIQNAFKEVADALAVHGTVDRQLAAQESLVHATAETYHLANSRYDKGIDSYLGVLDAQRSLFAAQQDLVFLRLAKLSNQVTLYAVLGGGWQSDKVQPGSTSQTRAK